MQNFSNKLFDPHLTLRNEVVSLRPLHSSDIQSFVKLTPELINIWQYFACKMKNADDMKFYIENSLKDQASGVRQTFVIEYENKIVGSTAFGNYSPNDQRIEIGWSFLRPQFQGTAINKNAKFLLLQFGFEHLNLERIELKTDMLNQRARNALLKIGATEEGVLRSHTLMPDSRRRDTIYYSILRSEWPMIAPQ